MKQPTLKNWLFQPFEYIAGLKGLVAGLIILGLTGFLGYLGQTHFDGVMDIHSSYKTSGPGIFFLEQLINWLSLSLILLVFGAWISSGFRLVDLLSTQALARTPMLLVAVIALFTPNQKVTQFILWKTLNIGEEVALTGMDVLLFGLFMVISIACWIWMIYLMFQAYRTVFHLQGTRAIITFFMGILVAEVLSKIILYFL